jgi:acyl carrier protein
MKAKKLNIDPEDVEDVLLKIEQSFDIEFKSEELKSVKTFGDLNAVVLSKISGENTNDCTAQQAFYRLRTTISKLNNSEIDINPQTALASIFPTEIRKQSVKNLEKELDIKLDILMPKLLIIRLLTLLLIVSFIALFLKPTYGFVGIVLSIILFEIAYKRGNEFSVYTLADLARKMSKYNYKKSRRHPLTVNLEEMKTLIKSIFVESLSLKNDELSDETIIL